MGYGGHVERDVLEPLDSIDWSAIHGSYGPVADLPRQVRLLCASDPAAGDALVWLADHLIHQGTRWQATPLAVPFLLDVLRDDATHRREQIIGLLLDFAVDEVVPLLPDGFNPDVFFADVKDAPPAPEDVRAVYGTKDWDDLDDRLLEIADRLPDHHRHDAYLAVERGAEVLMRLSADPNPLVRRETVWTLGWFPRVADRAAGYVRNAAACEADPYVLGIDLMVLGLLGRYLSDRGDVPLFEAHLRSENPLVVRRASALALGTLLGAEMPAEALDVLITAIDDDDGLRRDADGLGWSWRACSFKGYVWRVLHSVGL